MTFPRDCQGGRRPGPCLAVVTGEATIAVEVEPTAKASARLDEIVVGRAAAVDQGRFAGVRYLCSTEALPYVERSVGRTEAGDGVAVEQLVGVEALDAEQLS